MKPAVLVVALAVVLLGAGTAAAQVPAPGGAPEEVSPERLAEGDRHAELGREAFLAGREEEAFAAFEKSLAANPTVLTPTKTRAADALVAAAEDRLAAGEPERALAVVALAMRLNLFDPDGPYVAARAHYALAARERSRERVERAREMIRETVRRDATHGRAFLLWGEIALSVGEYRNAADGFRGALDRATEIRQARAGLAQALFFFGVELSGDPRVRADAILPVFQEAVDLLEVAKDDPAFAPALRANFRDLWIKSLVNLAATHQKAEELAAAELLLVRLAEIEPENHLHRYNLGLFYGEGRKYDRALENYRRALELAGTPDPAEWTGEEGDDLWVAPYPMMGYIHSQRDEPELAEKYLTAYVGKAPDDWKGWFQLGAHYSRTGRPEEAIAPLVRCVEIDPDDGAAIRELSLALRKARRTAEADQWLALYEATVEPEARQAGSAYPGSGRGAGGAAPGKR